MVHLFGFCGWDNEEPGRGGASKVGVVVNAAPQDSRKSLGTFVAQVLMVEPGATPEPPVRAGSLFPVFGNCLSYRQLGIQRLKAGWEIINQRHMISKRRRHGDEHAQARSSLNAPTTVSMALDVSRIVNRFITAFHANP